MGSKVTETAIQKADKKNKLEISPEEVKRIRKALGETQVEFAKRFLVDAITVARWEAGDRKCQGLYARTVIDLDPTQSYKKLNNEEITKIAVPMSIAHC